MDEIKEKGISLLDREICAELEKDVNAGSYSSESITNLKNAYKLKKYMEDDMMGYSTRRGRSMTTGRYVSRDNGSYDGSFGSYDGMSRRSYGSYERSGHKQIISELEKLYDKAQDNEERMMIDEWIQRAESQM